MTGFRSSKASLVLLASCLGLAPTPVSAQAMAELLPVAVASLCMTAPAPVMTGLQNTPARLSKAEAILGGAASRLDQLRAVQSGAAPQVEPAGLVRPAGMVQPCTIAPFTAARPAIPGTIFQPAPISIDRPNFFGTVALKISSTPLDRRWAGIRSAPIGAERGPWAPLVRRMRGEQRGRQIEAVNAWVNARIRFTDDRVAYGAADHWASAAQSLRKARGDCEDYAIAKMQLLKLLGVPAEDLYLVIAHDLVRRADHAVLVIRNGQGFQVLDNATDRLVDAAERNDFRPMLTYNSRGSWIHGYAARPDALALQTAASPPPYSRY